MTRRPATHLPDVFFRRRRSRNIRVLLTYLAAVVAIVTVEAGLFQLVTRAEGQAYPWVTAFYWVFSTMTTLGLGDIVFTSATGQVFTVMVLGSGILLILVVLPYTFIQFFAAPWLETRTVPERTRGHVIITSWDNIAPALVEKLEVHRIPYCVVEPDPARASLLYNDGISVAAGAVDDRATYERVRVGSARLVLANVDDPTNTNITLTVREVTSRAPVAALADSEESREVLRLAGANHVLPLKQRLGEELANRLNAGHAQSHVIGGFRDALIAEFPVHRTPFQGKRLREIELRAQLGLNVIGVLEHSRFVPASSDLTLTEHSHPIVVGTRAQIDELDDFLTIYDTNFSPVVVVGGGQVGLAATRMLKRKGLEVHMIEQRAMSWDHTGVQPDRLFTANAAEPQALLRAGLAQAPGVLLTTNDDAMNIYLAVRCRQLAPATRIVSRITHERNMVAIQRAGADLALSHTSIGLESVFAVLHGGEVVILGEGVELHELALPRSLEGRTLADSEIAARTGLNVIEIRHNAHVVTNPPTNASLHAGSTLLVVGNQAQLEAFVKAYG